VSSARLYLDEDAAENAVIVSLRQYGIDVLTVTEAGLQRHSDEDQLRFATSTGRTFYSLNVGVLARLHQEFLTRGEEHSGIIVIPRQRYSVGEKIRRLTALLDNSDSEAMRNSLHFL
jgi:Domain of unknown function (DUF5615)